MLAKGLGPDSPEHPLPGELSCREEIQTHIDTSFMRLLALICDAKFMSVMPFLYKFLLFCQIVNSTASHGNRKAAYGWEVGKGHSRGQQSC